MTGASTSRRLRIVAAGALTAAALPLLSALPAATAATPPAPTASVQAARYGGGWLASLIISAGGHVPSDPANPTGSAADAGATADAVVALHAAGVGRPAATAALRWLKGHFDAYVSGSGSGDDPGALAKVILAAHSAGVSVTAFGGTGPKSDLVARLRATQRTGGPDAGLFGRSDPTYDGAFRQGLALLALKAASRTSPAGIAWLRRQQCSNGGWVGYRANTSAACPAPDPATFSGPDTNSTALAFEGLHALGATPRYGALGFLASVQSRDGGFAYVAGRAQPADPNSTAVAIQAILAGGENPAAGRWVRSGKTPYNALLRFQLRCHDPVANRGAYYYDFGDGTRKPNVLATVQAVPAAAGATFPLRPSRPSSAVPTPPC